MKQQALLQSVQKILFHEWDPIGVRDNPECRNEYDSYAGTICRLLREGADEYTLLAHLQQLQKMSIGLLAIDEERDQLVAERLSRLYQKIHRNMRILMIPLLVVMTMSGCEVNTKPVVIGGNPPVIKFKGTGSLEQLFVMGPYTLEQLRQEYRVAGGKNALTTAETKEVERIRGDKGFSMWQLAPSRDYRVAGLSITYGMVPNGFNQVYPADGKAPEPLMEGNIYNILAPSAGSNFEPVMFMIESGKVVEVSPNQIANE